MCALLLNNFIQDRMENENENLEQSTSGPRVILIDIDDCESDNVEYEFGKMNQGE